LIELNHLTVRYPRAAGPALRDLSLRIEPGETALLLGPSGGGKSTLALTLAGLIPHDRYADVQGQVRVDGIDPLSAAPGEVAARVGLLFQDPEAGFATLTVEDEIAFGLENLRVPPEQMPGRIRAALDRVSMSGMGLRRLTTLSGGEAQRVALAALLAMDPPLLVLDEPTSNLDPASRREFFSVLGRLKPDRTILLIEHNLDACLPLADRVVALGTGGGLLAQGPPDPVFRDHLDEIRQTGAWLPESYLPSEAFAGARQVPDSGAPEGRPARGSRLTAVSCRGLSFGYDRREPVLQEVDLEIASGEFAALIGPNGSGKTTLARHFLGLLPPPQRGEVRLFGDRVQQLDLAELTRRGGYVFQNPEHQFVTDTVWEELAYSLQARRLPGPEVRAQVEGLLERFGLRQHSGRNPFTLSQGEKRRLSVATMLAVDQRLLILDEPTFGQDRRASLALMDALAGLNRRGVTVLIITHDMRLVRRHAHRVAVLVEGRVAYAGAPGELFQDTGLLQTARLI
jgi:energy-coupling factor transport system ATP-binding protein